MTITPFVISKNAEKTISQTLSSLHDFKEVIVLDTGSTDNTMKIARQFANVKLYQTTFTGFGKNKNDAAILANTDWVLSIDTDEVLTPALIQTIKSLKPQIGTVYKWKRCNFYKNKQIKHSGWGNDYVIRIYNKKDTSFKEKLVHEYVQSEGLKVETLKGEMNHFSYHSISDFSLKREFYSDLFATENKGKRKSSATTAIFHALFDFLKTFIVKRGFLDGYMGLSIAISNAYVTFIKYIKLHEANLELQSAPKEILPKPVFEPEPLENIEPSKRVFTLNFAPQTVDNKLNDTGISKNSILFLH